MSRFTAGIAAQPMGGFVPWSGTRSPAFTPWMAPANEVDPVDETFAPTVDEDVEDLRAEAYQAGYEAGRATLEADLLAERVAIERLAASLRGLEPEPAGPLALLLVETVDRLVRQVVGEVAVDPALLIARARAAAELIADETRPSAVRVHPDDHVRMAGCELPVPLVADTAVAPGSVLLETSAGWVEDGIAQRLDAVRHALARIDG